MSKDEVGSGVYVIALFNWLKPGQNVKITQVTHDGYTGYCLVLSST